MRHTVSSILLTFLLCILLVSVIPQVYATTETRYMRSDTFSWDLTYYAFNTTNSASYVTDSETWQTSGAGHGYLRSLIYVKYQDNTTALIATSAGFEVTSSTPTEYSETVNIPETALNTTDRIMVTVQYGPDGSTWTNIGYSFLTEQLGATLLNSATWTIYYWADFTSTYNPAIRRYNNELVFYHGDSDYPSRIEGFSYTTGVTKEWHDVTSWSLSLSTRQWNAVESWNFSIITKMWHDVATWTFNVITKAWNNVAEWSFQIITRTWHDISWTINLITRSWKNVVEWSLNLITLGWHNVALWTISLGKNTAVLWLLLIGLSIVAFAFVYIVFVRR